MKKNARSSSGVFQVSGNTVNADYSLINDVQSTDDSVNVELPVDAGSPVNLRISLNADPSVASVFEFNIEDSGIYVLSTVGNAKGLLWISSSGILSVLPSPEQGKAVLVTAANGNVEWFAAPGTGDFVLGIKNGQWHWYPVADCQNSCGEE